MANPKLLIVEDDNVILSIEKRRLSNLGFDVCGSTGTMAEAMECAAKMQPAGIKKTGYCPWHSVSGILKPTIPEYEYEGQGS